MLIHKIRSIQQGTIIPKPQATADFKIKGWGIRRGEPALIYWIPNHRHPASPLEKGITISEFERAHAEMISSSKFTRAWFNVALSRCAREGACNFTTIGGIFELLGLARYVSRGLYLPC